MWSEIIILNNFLFSRLKKTKHEEQAYHNFQASTKDSFQLLQACYFTVKCFHSLTLLKLQELHKKQNTDNIYV